MSTSFVLTYLDDIQGEFPTLNEAINQVRRNYEDWNATPALNNIPGGFPFKFYEVLQKLDIDFESIITTNHRGSIPKSYRGEGVNFID